MFYGIDMTEDIEQYMKEFEFYIEDYTEAKNAGQAYKYGKEILNEIAINDGLDLKKRKYEVSFNKEENYWVVRLATKELMQDGAITLIFNKQTGRILYLRWW